MIYYALKNRKVVPVGDIKDTTFENESRIISRNYFFPNTENEIMISTVFLCIDHSFSVSIEPILFETMVFGGEHDSYQDRYTTWSDAVYGHNRVVDMVKESINKVK